jgi:O-antigen ligase
MGLHTACAWVAALFLASSVFAHTAALRLLLLAFGIVLASVVTWRDREVRVLPPVWLPFILWGAWAALSWLWSLEPERTLKEWRNEVFYTGAALWICYVGAQARGAARIFLPAVAVAAAAACLFALHAYSAGWVRYAEGWHGGSGDHSSALLVLMPGVLIGGWWALRQRQPFWIAASLGTAALFFASAYTTLNRTIWLGFAAQFAVLAAFLFVRRGVSASTRRLIPALAVAVAVGCGALLVSLQAERQVAGAGGKLENEARLLLWPYITRKVSERPLTGHGFGRGMLRDSLQADLRQRDSGAPEPNLWHAHNYFLDATLQTGVAGLLLFVLLLGAVLREAWRAARVADDWIAAGGMVLVAVAAGMVVRNMTDTLLVRQNALLFWGVVGVLLAMAKDCEAR